MLNPDMMISHCLVDVLMLLLLSYHRHVKMISEALWPYVERWRVSHSWCMGVDGHGYGGLGRAGMGGWYACGAMLGVCRMQPVGYTAWCSSDADVVIPVCGP